MKVVYSADCALHNPPHEILSGKLVAYLEAPARYQCIKDALSPRDVDPMAVSASFELVEADLSRDIQASILAVHEKDYVEYVENAFAEWVEDGGDKAAVLPECFAHSALVRGKKYDASQLPPIAKAGLYWYYKNYITDLLHSAYGVKPKFRPQLSHHDTYASVTAAVHVALTASRILISQLRESKGSAAAAPRGVFALTRPPGHHAGTSTCGGYCFFNNAAIAVRFMQSEWFSPAQQLARAAILDIDYHHGNGTQEVFYEDPTVFYASIHADNDYPYFTGAANEEGIGQGQGFNLNIPLPKGVTGDDEYCVALQDAIGHVSRFDPAFLVVSLGVDTFADDPICDFKLTEGAYARIGTLIASLQKPTLFVMEGGYDLDTIGRNIRSVLENFLTASDARSRT